MELFDEDDMSDFLDGADDDYEEDLSPWNYDDWLASGIETSADLNQFVDNEYVRLTSLAPPNSTLPLDVAEQLRTLPTDSSSSSTLVYSLIDLTENCISPALSQLVNQLSWILIFCCLFRLLCLSKLCSSRTLHYVQIGASIVILYNYFHFQSIYLLTYIFMGYLAFQVCLDKCRNYLTYIIVCFSLIYVLACEFILIEREQWHSKSNRLHPHATRVCSRRYPWRADVHHDEDDLGGYRLSVLRECRRNEYERLRSLANRCGILQLHSLHS